MGSHCVQRIADQEGNEQHSGRQGKKQKAEKEFVQGKEIQVALVEDAELICGTRANKIGPHCTKILGYKYCIFFIPLLVWCLGRILNKHAKLLSLGLLWDCMCA